MIIGQLKLKHMTLEECKCQRPGESSRRVFDGFKINIVHSLHGCFRNVSILVDGCMTSVSAREDMITDT